ncbi:hypothetical protein Nepgr_004510 [Nepenthes gracilis]|uniref:Uncharacterized protein n=1 Tax=Nepenthes gracilis TaxID=150966 RepID=A0AAD3XFH2_NEPGR|nr:hypothetical protein Nepgr_004510 [Nepenthes gracilis]
MGDQIQGQQGTLEQQQKVVHEQHAAAAAVMDQFTFNFGGEEEAGSMLQLSTLAPHHSYPYRLQPTQPNLQDSNILHRHGRYGTYLPIYYYILHTFYVHRDEYEIHKIMKQQASGIVTLVFVNLF